MASSMAAQRMRTDGSAVVSASARSREKVAMPHWRGGHVATNPMSSPRSAAGLAPRPRISIAMHPHVRGRGRRLGPPPYQDGHDRGGQRPHGRRTSQMPCVLVQVMQDARRNARIAWSASPGAPPIRPTAEAGLWDLPQVGHTSRAWQDLATVFRASVRPASWRHRAGHLRATCQGLVVSVRT